MKARSDTLAWLRRYESPNVTFIDPEGDWPVVWEKAKGMHVWDDRGRRYLDMTAAFGVVAAGHANPRIVQAGQRQMARLGHAMGDVHPHALKARLVRELSRLTFERWKRRDRSRSASRAASGIGKAILGNSGFEAVEAALKTARLATQKCDVIAFEGGYHGLGYGTLNATHRDLFREPFLDQLGRFGRFVTYPTRAGELAFCREQLDRHCASHAIGAVLVEPLQGRGGNRVPPPGFLPMLRKWCDVHGALLILDEIYTGFGRTGKWFACEHSGVVPDLICLGKALTGGFPLSACVGRAEVMDAAWPRSQGEAIHTSTYLGHPVGCAMALAQLEEIRTERLVVRSAQTGTYFFQRLRQLTPPKGWRLAARGQGLMLGVEFIPPDGATGGQAVMRLVKGLLKRGFLVLPEGDEGQVLSFTPPLIVTRRHIDRLIAALNSELQRL